MVPIHPLQTKEWALFRQKTGCEVVTVASGYTMTIHKLPISSYTIGYIPKSKLPTKEIIEKLYSIGRLKKCIFIKLEPNVIKISNYKLQITNYDLRKSAHPLFTPYTFYVDLTKSEEELLMRMKPKTRYNVKIAQKNNVIVKEETSQKAFDSYIALSKETWERQKFHAHGENYHRLMWETLSPSGIAHLLIAYYKDQPVVAWILFLYQNILYYPYGASSNEYKQVMASNLMMWEAIRLGKKHGATLFDLWGAIGPNPDPKDPWYGFHKFKEGYGGNLVEFIGSFDLVIHPLAYNVYNLIYPLRKKLIQ